MPMQKIQPLRTGFKEKLIVITVNTKVMQAMSNNRLSIKAAKHVKEKANTANFMRLVN